MDEVRAMFDKYAQQYAAVPMFPYLLCPRITLLILKLRIDSGVSFAHQHPLSSWVTAVMSCFAGTLITNFLLGNPLLPILLEVEQIMVISIIWYLVFFCPFDLFAKIFMEKPLWVGHVMIICQYLISKLMGQLLWSFITVVLLVLMEMFRARSMLVGVDIGLSKYSDSWLIIIVLGVCKGCGSRLFRPIAMFIQGKVDMGNEALYPSFVSKLSIVGSILFIMVHKRLTSLSMAEALVCVAAVGAALQVLMYLSDVRDPFTHLEKGVAAVLFREPSEKANTMDSKKKKD